MMKIAPIAYSSYVSLSSCLFVINWIWGIFLYCFCWIFFILFSFIDSDFTSFITFYLVMSFKFTKLDFAILNQKVIQDDFVKIKIIKDN